MTINTMDMARMNSMAIHLHHVVDLVTDRSHGPQVPELIREMPEGASGHAELALGLFREQPPQEQL